MEITNVNKSLTTNSAKQVATMEMTALDRSTYRELPPDPESVVPGVVSMEMTALDRSTYRELPPDPESVVPGV
ncbi:MAG: hypothetical protein KDA36_10005, partial [Planctomycetaceae bacterium]|nr:hypothetical protein [Planctomycetaceae bacterium]